MLKPKDVNLIKDMYEAGKPISFIAKEFNITKQEVISSLKSCGIDTTINRKWTKEEEEQLRTLSEYLPAPEIADILNRTPKAVAVKMQRLGLQSVRAWTEEDENFLMDYWGIWQVEVIANQLNRSVKAVREKAIELNLLSARNEAGYFKLNDIATITGLSLYKIKSFEKKGLKIRVNYITRKSKFYYIEMEDLMDFLEKNQNLYSAAKFQLSYFYNCPDWLKEKKKQDMKACKRGGWTFQEKAEVKEMFSKGIKISDIAEALNRTKDSVCHVCYEKSV